MNKPLLNGENIVRDESGKFLPGHPSMSPGRPKGKLSIKTLIKRHLEEHPEDLKEFVEYFIKNNRELSWQMLEGRPHQSSDAIIDFPTNLIDLFKNVSTEQEGDNQSTEQDQE